jgi:carotenoid 1,2-hydratase
VFSPYYAAARRRGPADPLDHNAFNLALYGPARHCWAMTERGRRRLERSPEALRIGPSAIAWRNETLVVDIDERCAPWPRRLRGRLRLWPQAFTQATFELDAAGRHRWSPIAPRARIDVAFDDPALRWQGSAYLDANDGDAALDADFDDWTWSRTALADGGTAIHYDVQRHDGSTLALALDVGADGRITPATMPPLQTLPRTGWGIDRPARGASTLARTLEDGPFYARSLLTRADGSHAVHESLSLARFRQRWVQALLPFRMPRRA